jgi:hypothetical protein
MNLPALKGGVSCKRCIIYEVRSVRQAAQLAADWGACGAPITRQGAMVYYQTFGGVALHEPPQSGGVLNQICRITVDFKQIIRFLYIFYQIYRRHI